MVFTSGRMDLVGLFTDDSTHLADGLHGADQILLHVHHTINTSKIELGKVYWKLSVDMLQQRAVSGHGLLDLFFCGFSHLWEPPNIMKVIGIQLAGAALRCPQRGGIIAPAEAGKKWLN